MSETLIIVVSIFGLIGLGYASARTGLLSPDVGTKLGHFVFTLPIPFLIFNTLAKADLHGISPWRIWAGYFVPWAIVWVIAHLMVVHVFGRDNRAGIVAGGSAAYSNSVLIGIPLMQASLGDQGMVFLIVIVLIHLPLLTLVSVVLNELALTADQRPGEGSRGERWRQVALSLATNPIMIGIFLGIFWRVTGLPIPRVVAAVIDPLARSAGPLALFATGMTLVSYGIARQIRPAAAIAALKLVLLPALVLGMTWLIGLSPMGIAAITLTASSPTGVNAPLIAIRMGTGEALASNALLISNGAGVVTVAAWLFVVREFVLG